MDDHPVFHRETHDEDCSCDWCRAYDRLWRKELRQRRARLLSMIRPSGDEECWVWAHSLTPDGYGRIAWNGWSQLAHRVAYELFVGPIPEDLQIDHRCRNRACVNPLPPACCNEHREQREPLPRLAARGERHPKRALGRPPQALRGERASRAPHLLRRVLHRYRLSPASRGRAAQPAAQ